MLAAVSNPAVGQDVNGNEAPAVCLFLLVFAVRPRTAPVCSSCHTGRIPQGRPWLFVLLTDKLLIFGKAFNVVVVGVRFW